MIFSPNLFVMLKILSSEYQLYACGKIFRMPRFWTKIFILQEAQESGISIKNTKGVAAISAYNPFFFFSTFICRQKLFLLTIEASYIYIEKFIFILVTKKGV
jgi:hypothetical protein